MQYTVGKPKFKIAFSKGIIYIIWAVFLFFFGYNDAFKIFSIFLLGVIIVIVIPGIAYCKLMWKVDDIYLKYTYHHTFLDKIVSFYTHLLKTKQVEYQISIYLAQIDYIKVTYVALPKPPVGKLGYDVLFKVYTYDGSEFVFESYVSMNKNEFLDAVDYMKNKGIIFEDDYNILNIIKSDVRLSKYLEEIHNDRIQNDKNFHPNF